MKFVEQQVEYWPQEKGIEGIWNQIARAARVCYQAAPRENETAEEYVNRVILKPALMDGRYDFDKMHGAMLEHGTVYLSLPFSEIVIQDMLRTDYHSRCAIGDMIHITTNMRVLYEKQLITEDKDYVSFYIVEPTKYHVRRHTFNVVTDIGTTREMNRNRSFSIAEESTRFCDYTKDKFGSELTFVKPMNAKDDTPMLRAFSEIESAYRGLRNYGWRPEEARCVLPLGLKTQAVYTAFEDDWQHFIKLRADNYSGKCHPHIHYIANQIKQLIPNS